jgi:hypothetical protein
MGMKSDLQNLDKRLLTKIVKKLDDDRIFNKTLHYNVSSIIDEANDSIQIFGLDDLDYLDVEFLFQLEEKNRSLFKQIFKPETSKEERLSLVNKIVIPTLKKFNVDYRVSGTGTIEYDYNHNFETYLDEFTSSQLEILNNEMIFEYWEGDVVHGPEIMDWETHDIRVIDSNIVSNNDIKESVKLSTIESMDKKTLLFLKEIIDKRLSLL